MSDKNTTIGVITETNDRDTRERNLNTITDALEDIDGVTDAVWDANPRHLDQATLRVGLENEKKRWKGTYTIEHDLQRVRHDINAVLDDHTEKFNDTWTEIRSPQYVDTNEYRDATYEIDLAII